LHLFQELIKRSFHRGGKVTAGQQDRLHFGPNALDEYRGKVSFQGVADIFKEISQHTAKVRSLANRLKLAQGSCLTLL